MFKRSRKLASLAALLAMAAGGALAGPGIPVEVWKSPTCGCCEGWIRHMKAAGFDLRVHDVEDVTPIKTAKGLPLDLGSCHTAEVAGYVVEGHVPALDIRRMILTKPEIKGIAAPGMPQSAPGMETPGRPIEPYSVIAFGGKNGNTVFAKH